MIISVCADKGSPGVSWTSILLAMLWPQESVLLEADVSGGDAALRLRDPRGGLLARQPSLRTLGVDVRGSVPSSVTSYRQATSLGFSVVPAIEMQSSDMASIAQQWSLIADAARSWPETTIADLGRLQEQNASGPLAAASTVVLLVGRPTPESMHHLRERAKVLRARLGQGIHGHSPLAVALICSRAEHRTRLDDLRVHLAAEPTTSDIAVLGWIADDRRAIEDLHTGAVTKRFARGDLAMSMRTLVDTLLTAFPELTGASDAARAAEGDSHSQWAPDNAVQLTVPERRDVTNRSALEVGGWS